MKKQYNFVFKSVLTLLFSVSAFGVFASNADPMDPVSIIRANHIGSSVYSPFGPGSTLLPAETNSPGSFAMAPSVIAQNVTVSLDANGNASIAQPIPAQTIYTEGFDGIPGGVPFAVSNLNSFALTFGSVDVGGYVNGSNSIDLAGNSNAIIQRTDYLPAGYYSLSFQHLLNNNPAGGNFVIAEIIINGATIASQNFSSNSSVQTAVLNFSISSLELVMVRLTQGGPNDAAGSFVDNISLIRNACTEYLVHAGNTGVCGGLILSVSQENFTCADLGSNSVVLTGVDPSGAVFTSNAIVTVQDPLGVCNQSPLAVCKSTPVILVDGSCTANITPADIDNGSSDPDGDPLSFNVSPTGPFAVGNHLVTLTVTDPSGASSSCTSTISVQDQTLPTMVTQPATIQLDQNGEGSIVLSDILLSTADNCGVQGSSASKLTFNCNEVGPNTVIVTVTDVNGNVAQQNVTVTVLDVLPINALDDSFSLSTCAPFTFTAADLLGNDTDPYAQNMQVDFVSNPTSGTISDNGNGTWTYTPGPNTNHVATASYIVKRDDGTILFPNNGHFYEFISSPGITWSQALVEASNLTYNGQQGYLVTITSAAENQFAFSKLAGQAWIGANDSQVEREWRWVTGPEAGTYFYNQATGQPVNGAYTNWQPGEPNDFSTGEDVAHFRNTGQWNDFPNNAGTQILGYIVEYGGLPGDCTFNSSNTAQISFNLIDNTPPVALAQNISVQIDGSGLASFTASQINNGSSDNCGIASLTVSPSSFDCSQIGNNQVTLTVTDNNGNQATAVATVNVSDPFLNCNQPPVASCIDLLLEADGNCQASPTPAQIGVNSTDPDGDPLTFTLSPPPPYNLGVTNVTLTATDPAGLSSSCSAVITVEDGAGPNLVCQDATLYLDANGQAVLQESDVVVTAQDNCSAVTVGLSQTVFDCSGALNSSANIGTLTGVLTADNAFDAYISTDDNVQGTLVASGNDWPTAYSINVPNLTPGQQYYLHVKAEDVGGIEFFGGTFQISGAFEFANGTQSLATNTTDWQVSNSGWSGYGTPYFVGTSGTQPPWGTATNNLGACQLIWNLPHNTPGFDTRYFTTPINPVIGSGVTVTATDAANNSSICVANVSILDTISPLVAQLGSVASASLNSGACEGTVFLTPPSFTDNCTQTVNVTSSSPQATSLTLTQGNFPVGTHDITYTATDESGNQTTSIVSVTLVDTESPLVVTPGSVSSVSPILNTCSGTAFMNPPVFADNCTQQLNVTVTCPTATSLTLNQGDFPIGNHTVTYTATDNSGNAISSTVDVTVTDLQNPDVVLCAQLVGTTPVTGSCEFDVFWSTPVFTDNCSGTVLVAASSSIGTNVGLSQGTFPVGIHTVTFAGTDDAGNSTSCSIQLNVQDDVVPTMVVQDATVQLDQNGQGSIQLSDILVSSSDDCGVVSESASQLNFDCNEVGANNVVVSITDVNGNVAQQSVTVTVLDVLPITANDDSFTLDNCTPITFTAAQLLGNDTDPYGQPLQVDFVGTPSSGTIVDNGNDTWTYTPGSSTNHTATASYIVKRDDGTIVFSGNGHFYEFVPDVGITWAQAKADAEARTYNGQQGYLVTITSASENQFAASKLNGQAWIGANDSQVEREWRWVTGPEAGTYFYNQATGQPVNGAYTNWEPGEPNDFSTGEDVAHFRNSGLWNDFPNNAGAQILGYIVEYGGLSGDCTFNSSNTAQITFDLNDVTPPVAVAQNISVQIDGSGLASFTASQINNGSSDNCGIASLTVSPSSFDCSQIGNNQVTLTVTDNNGNQATAVATVNVSDPLLNCNQPPVASCVDLLLPADGNCQANPSGAAIAGNSSDPEGQALSYSLSPAPPYGIGVTSVTVTVTDPEGASSQCVSTITVVDNASPNLVCQDATIQLDANGQATLTQGDVVLIAQDNCSATTVTISQTSFDCSGTVNSPANAGVLTGTLSADNQFNAYISTDDNVQGTLISSGNSWPTAYTLNPANLTPGQQYYLHVEAADLGGPEFFAGTFALTGGFEFANGTQSIGTNTTDWKVGLSGWNNYGTPLFISVNGTSPIWGSTTLPLGPCDLIWGGTFNTLGSETRYFSTPINPVNSTGVTITATDASGNSSICQANVTVEDNIAPQAVAQSITLNLDVNQSAVLTGSDLDDGSSDNCGIVSYSVVSGPTSFTCAQLGQSFPVVLEVADAAGNTSQAPATVTIGDVNGNCNQPPVSVCASPTVNVDLNSCTASVAPTVMDGGSSDPDGDALTYAISPAGPFGLGTHTVVLTVTDPSGESSSCSGTLTVVDNQAPNVICTGVTIALDANGLASITPGDVAVASDNCSAVSLSLSQSSFDCSNVGANTVTVTATDAAGNSSVCQATVTVVDAILPAAVCQNLTVQLDASGVASITAADVNNGSNDACGIASIAIDNGSFGCANVGPNTVTLTVTDNNGNVSTCQSTVTVEDNVAPVAICQDLTIQLDASGVASITAADVNNGSNDACGIASIAIDNGSFGCANVGPNTVTLTVTDNNGNVSTCQSTVTVEDNVAPVAICQDLTIQLDASGAASITAADVNNGSNDACGIASIAIDNGSFGCGSVGPNTVTMTVTDNNGNVSTCTSTVTVQDNIAPVAICQDLTIQLDASGAASITAADVNNGSNDACGIASIAIDNGSFGCANVGPNTVTLTVTDNNGNVSTCQSTVTVEDNVAPIALCQDLTIQLDASGAASITAADVNNGSNDACGIASIAIDKGSFNCDDIGPNTVTLTVTDNNGNVSTCQSTVTVEDNIPPVITNCPQDITVSAVSGDCSGLVGWTLPTISDNCPTSILVMSMAPGATIVNNTIGLFPVGTTPVTILVGDAGGNAVSCTFNVTVTDDEAPIITGVPTSDLVVPTNPNSCDAQAFWAPFQASDNCSGVSLTQSHFSGQTFPLGTTTVSATATDSNGNSTTTSFNIVIVDNTPPVALCQDLTVQLDASGAASITAADVDNGSNDACGIASIAIDNGSFGCGNVGPNTVTLTVTDNNGNVSTCQSTVTVQDNVAPIAICQDLTVQLDASGAASITAADVDNGSNDACGIASIAIDNGSFGCGDVGPNTVTLTVTDNNGNVSTCQSTVTVQDNVAPIAICQDLTIQLDASGAASITAADVDNGSNDACGIASIAIDNGSFGCGNVGPNTVTLTVTDNNGNVSTCQSTVTVEDNVAPIAICQDLTVQLDASGAASIAAADVDNGSNDACGIASIAIDNGSFGCGDVGPNTVTLTVTDNNGNVSTCQSTVNVQDNVAPVAVCQDVVITLNNAASGSITAADIDGGSNDACGIASLVASQTSFDCGDVGTVPVTLTVTDNNGNVSTCVANVTVVEFPQTVTASASETTINTVAGCGPTSSDLTATSDLQGVTFTWSPATGLSSTSGATVTATPGQTTTYTVTATNGGCSETQTVTVNVDDPIDPNKPGKVLICHKRKKKGNTTWNTISVSINALQAHLGHGDYCGPCVSSNSNIEVADGHDEDEFHTALYPNPTAQSSVFTVETHEDTEVVIEVYSLQGVLVQSVFEGPLSSGIEHHFELDAGNMAAGVYHVILRSHSDMQTKRWIIQK